MPDTVVTVDRADLEARVKEVYRAVADHPDETYHFETGRSLAERLGYAADLLDRVPAAAVDSFAGVGWFFDLAGLRPGERVVDLGSGSGTDVFVAALHVGDRGQVTGIDMTDAQLRKADSLRDDRWPQVRFIDGQIDALPLDDGSCDCVISNGVINLAADKPAVFREAARVLRPGGRLAIADIVTVEQLPEAIICDAGLWAACIGGAAQLDHYQRMISAAGFTLVAGHRNAYEFLSGSARAATEKFGVCSVSLLAQRA